ncbi:MAG: SMC-Scp complex subunit ScpB [Spirochaetia bacterium]|nr:SMC-Scp complex subunit ScpB [Spirochaetia bacterium]
MLTELAKLIEVLLFLENEPIAMNTFLTLTQEKEEDILLALEEIGTTFTQEGHGLELVETLKTYQLIPTQDLHENLKKAYGKKVDKRLSKAALETLSIIAYAQPVTRSDVENIRGVSSDSIMRLLLEREYIRRIGKKDVPGRPMLYGTSKKFLLEFNLPSISALPKLSDIDRERFLHNEEGLLL